jgi:hypothetical protein
MADARISCEDGVFKAGRICISSVKAVGQLAGMKGWNDFYHRIAAFHAWHICSTSILGHGTDQSENFSRLILCEELNLEKMDGSTLSNFLLSVLGMIVIYCSEKWPDIAADTWLTELAESRTESEDILRTWVELLISIFKCRLFTTTEGTLGMAEESVMERDLVCILFGCSIPVVLRGVSVTVSILAMRVLWTICMEGESRSWGKKVSASNV